MASSSSSSNPEARPEPGAGLRRWFLQLEAKLNLPNGTYRPPNWPNHLASATRLLKGQAVHLEPATGIVYVVKKSSDGNNQAAKTKQLRPCGWLQFSYLEHVRGILKISPASMYLETTVSSYHFSHYSQTQIGRVAVQIFGKVPNADTTLPESAQQKLFKHASNLACLRDKYDKKKKVAYEPRGILYVDKKIQITAAEWKRRFLGKFLGGSGHAKKTTAGKTTRNGVGGKREESGATERLSKDEQLAKLYETEANVYEKMPMAECPPGFDLHPHQRKGLHWMLEREATDSIGPHWKIHQKETTITVDADGVEVNVERLLAANPMPQAGVPGGHEQAGRGHGSYIATNAQKQREAEHARETQQARVRHQREVIKRHNVTRKQVLVPTGKASYNTGGAHDVATIPVPRGGIVADEMGLGKTRQTIAAIAQNVKPRTLVVAPAAVVYEVWKAELEYHLLQNDELAEKMASPMFRVQKQKSDGGPANTVATPAAQKAREERENDHPAFRIYVYHGHKKEIPPPHLEEEEEEGVPSVTITSYETLVSKAVEFKKRKWSRLVLDEAHEVRNKNCKAFKVLAEMVGAGGGGQPEALRPRHEMITWLLTATPFVNKIDDLYPLFALLRVTPLEDYAVWRASISAPAGEIIEEGINASKNCEQEAKNVGKGKGLERANLLLREFMLRRRKNDRVLQPGAKAASCLLQLPEKRCYVVKLPFAAKEQEVEPSSSCSSRDHNKEAAEADKAQLRKFNAAHAKMYQNLWGFATTELIEHQHGATAITFSVIAKLRQLSLSPMLLPKSWREVLLRGDIREILDLILPKPKEKKTASGASSLVGSAAQQRTAAAAGAVVKVKKGQRFDFHFGAAGPPGAAANGPTSSNPPNTNLNPGGKTKQQPIGKSAAEIFAEYCVDEDCSICQDAFVCDDAADDSAIKKIVCLAQCGHVFHESCVEASFAQLRRECPLCRHPIPEAQYKFYLEQGAPAAPATRGTGEKKYSPVEQVLETPHAVAEFDAAPKVQKILELIGRSTGPVLVFSSFKQFLVLLRQSVDAKLKSDRLSTSPTSSSLSPRHQAATELLCGGLPPKRKSVIVKAFQAGETKVLFCSLRASGVGLTLTKAKTVILAEPHWNSPMEEQAIARAHRLGLQHRVNVYRLVMTHAESPSGDTFATEGGESGTTSGSGSPSSSSSRSSGSDSDSESDSQFTSDSAVGQGPLDKDDDDDDTSDDDDFWSGDKSFGLGAAQHQQAAGAAPTRVAATAGAGSSSSSSSLARPGLAAGGTGIGLASTTAAAAPTPLNEAVANSTQDISAAASAFDRLTLEERMREMQKRKQEVEQVSADTKMKREEMQTRQKKMMNSLVLDLLRGPTTVAGAGGKRLQPWEVADDGHAGAGSSEQNPLAHSSKRARRN